MSAVRIDWQKEGLRYAEPHPRLMLMARIVSQISPRAMLDVGCATATLRQLIPDTIEYFGCDVSDLARGVLDADHFRQIDLNASPDLSAFAGRGITLVHVSGVLEYLDRPDALLRAAHALVGAQGRLVGSIINFQSRRFSKPRRQHRGWIFKPTLPELRRLLADTGWIVEKEHPHFDTFGLRHRLTVWWPEDPQSWSTRRSADQFVVVARAG